MIAAAWAWFRRPRVALALILLLIPGAGIGTLVPQVGRAPPSELEAWGRAHEGAAPFVTALGLHEVYSSPLFLALLGGLILSTASCTAHHVGRELAAGRPGGLVPLETLEPVDPAGGAPLDLPEAAALAPVLARAGYRTSSWPTADGWVLSGRKGSLGGWGSVVFHASLGVALAAGLFSAATRRAAYTEVVVGQAFVDRPADYLQVAPGPLSWWRDHTGTEITLERLGRGEGSLHLRSAAGERSAELAVNAPIEEGPLTIYLGDFNGPAVLLARCRGAERDEGYVHLARPVAGGGDVPSPAFGLPGTPFGVACRLLPERSLKVEVRERARGVVAAATLRRGEVMALPDGSTLAYVDLSAWTTLEVLQDDVAPLYAALAGCLVGLVVMLFSERWQVWVVATGSTRGLLLGGQARKAPAFLREELDALRIALLAASRPAAPCGGAP